MKKNNIIVTEDVNNPEGVDVKVYSELKPNGSVEVVKIEKKDKLARSHEDLLKALYWAFDIFERAAMPFFLVYKTAEDVLETKQLEGDAIQVGVRDVEWASGARRIQDPYTEVEENVFEFKSGDVPIILHIFKDDQCIKVPDSKVYYNEVFNMPNPYSRFKEIYG